MKASLSSWGELRSEDMGDSETGPACTPLNSAVPDPLVRNYPAATRNLPFLGGTQLLARQGPHTRHRGLSGREW